MTPISYFIPTHICYLFEKNCEILNGKGITVATQRRADGSIPGIVGGRGVGGRPEQHRRVLWWGGKYEAFKPEPQF